MIRYLTAGESHGPALVGILEGMPAGVEIEENAFKDILRKRQAGYGRGKRCKIETENVEVLSGIVNGKTIGSPIALMIRNTDYENHKHYMAPFNTTNLVAGKINVPLPGHADLAGMEKYGFDNCRYVRERASARETAIRTAISVPARSLLNSKGIKSLCMVSEIGGIEASINIESSFHELEKAINTVGDEFLTPDKSVIEEWKNLIDDCEKKHTSLGGCGIIIVYNLPVGLGSYVEYDRKLDGRIAAAVMSVPAIKACEIGCGIELSRRIGNSADKIIYSEEKGFSRFGNCAGGLEGGVTNGQPLIIKFYMKPLPANNNIDSVDLITKKASKPASYRSDIQAVTAAAVVVESVVLLELASAVSDYYRF